MFHVVMDYQEKDVVWVKLQGYPWWPAQVKSTSVTENTKDKKGGRVCVYFFNEDGEEDVKWPSKIKPFDCPEKESFKTTGFSIKNKERKSLFVQALSMAGKLTGIQMSPDITSNTSEAASFINGDVNTDSCEHDTEKSCLICKNKEENELSKDGEKSTCLKTIKENNTFRLSNDEKSSGKNQSPSHANYSKFKIISLQHKVDWNNTCVNGNETYGDVSNIDMKDGVHINGADTNSNKRKASNLNFKCKKRKLTYDENCNGNIKQRQKTSAVDMSLPVLSKTSTPKQRKNNASQSKITIIKTFTKLSQKTDKDKPKRGRKPKSKSVLQEAMAESEMAKTPKSLKWGDSFELPTPSLSQTATCDTFLTNTSFDPNLDKDTCDTSSDSDTELPEGLSPIVGEFPILKNDIVWLRWKKCPAWPAFVRRIYRKKKRIHKLSLAFIEGYSDLPKRLRVTYRSKCIVPFIDKQKDQFIQEGESIPDPGMRQKFREACEKAENFLHKKALVSLNRDEFSFFGECDEEEEVESDTNENNPPNCEPVFSDVEERLSDSESEDLESNRSSSPVYQSIEPTAKETERLMKMTAKQEKLVEYIKSDEMKKYLLDIFYERKKSELHQKYFHGTIKEKNSLKYAGFGPIYNEDQEEEIVEITKKWLYELPKKDLPDMSYILDVWIPEAIVYALIKVKQYNRKRAWAQFEKGVYMTKTEKERQHQSMLQFIGYTEEEKQEVLERAQERMETFKYKHGLI